MAKPRRISGQCPAAAATCREWPDADTFGVRACQHRFGFVAQPFVIVSSRPFRIHFSTLPAQSFAKESKAVLTHAHSKGFAGECETG